MLVAMVRIENRHYNAAQLRMFYWFEGRLYMSFVGQSVYEIINDPDRKYYYKLCDACCVRPIS